LLRPAANVKLVSSLACIWPGTASVDEENRDGQSSQIFRHPETSKVAQKCIIPAALGKWPRSPETAS